MNNRTKKGKIIKINKDIFTVKLSNEIIDTRIRGKLRDTSLTVGDNVLLDKENMIIELLERKNSLVRPKVSNIDKLFIVVSTEIPRFNQFLLDKMICLAEINLIEPIIIFTKLDVAAKDVKKEINDLVKYYQRYYKVYSNKDIRKIVKEINYHTVALCGQTGAGKSSLLNKLDKTLNLKTNEVSKALGRGKHTTRLVELMPIKKGYAIDTPGFSSLDIEIKPEELKYFFADFDNECKYSNCLHIDEEGCRVIEKLRKNKILKSRYDSYLKILRELQKEK